MQTFLVGGALNGKCVDLDETTRVLKVPFKRNPNAWVADFFELYALGDKGANGFRYHVGSEDVNGWPIEHAESFELPESEVIRKNYRKTGRLTA